MFRQDPGPCSVCGAAHTACTADSGPITVVQLPARDARPAVEAVLVDAPALGDGSDGQPFSTGTY